MKNYIYYLGIFSLLILSSCEEVIDFELNEGNKKLIIDAQFTTEAKQHVVKISMSGSYYGKPIFEKVSGASVSISSDSTVYIFTEIEPGLYLSDSNAYGIQGKTYQLTVQYNGETYQSEATIKRINPLQSVFTTQTFDTIPIINEIDSSHSLWIVVQEPKGQGDFYLGKYYINGILETDTVREYSWTDDSFIDGQFIVFPVYNIDHKKVKSGDIIKLELFSIEKSYSDYLFSILLQTDFKGGLFDGPAANVKGNISNGALGFFVASDVTTKETIIP